LPAHWSFANMRFKALQLKRKTWGGREGDGELTKAKKKSSNQPASSDDEQPKPPISPNPKSSVSRGWTRVLDEKRKLEDLGVLFIASICRVRLGNPEILDGFGWSRRRSPARPRWEEEGDWQQGPTGQRQKNEGKARLLDIGWLGRAGPLRRGPAHAAGAGKAASTRWPKERRRPSDRASRPLCSGKLFYFFFFFLFFICLFSNYFKQNFLNQIKIK
jgi:hypothetical protein